jgi:hypothetical protein
MFLPKKYHETTGGRFSTESSQEKKEENHPGQKQHPEEIFFPRSSRRRKYTVHDDIQSDSSDHDSTVRIPQTLKNYEYNEDKISVHDFSFII